MQAIAPPEIGRPARRKPEQGYAMVDRASGFVVLAVLVAAPWLFGATELWLIRLLNLLSYLAGGLIAVKWFIRWRSGALAVERIWRERDSKLQSGVWMTRAMAVLTLLALFYCLISGLNARATWFPAEHRFEYHAYVPWLPFTYDSILTRQAFLNYLALACFFWALRDWLMHPPRNEALEAEVVLGLPPRIRTLLWVIALNATALSLEGTFQRLSGTTNLLWFRPSYDDIPDNMFGPFAFRGNAAQYLNLAWPAILGLWWAEREKARVRVWDGRKAGGAPHILLLLCAVLVGAAPMIAASQGGAIISLAMLAAALFVFLINRRGTWKTRGTILGVCAAVLALGGALGWDQLAPRLREAFRTPYANPNEVYNNARQMALDYPLFGTGPGAFRVLYPLYRSDSRQPSQAFLHDDWLETRVTFGWAGSMLILCLLGLALTRWFVPGGISGQWELAAMLWIATAGCLAHAKFSFPLQVYSILMLFLALLAVLSSISRPET